MDVELAGLVRSTPDGEPHGEHPTDHDSPRENEPLHRVRQVGALTEIRSHHRLRETIRLRRRRGDQLEVHRRQIGELSRQSKEVETLNLGEQPIRWVPSTDSAALLARAKPAEHLHLGAGQRRIVDTKGNESAVDEHDPTIVEEERRDEVVAGAAVLRPVHHPQRRALVVGARHRHRSPSDSRVVNSAETIRVGPPIPVDELIEGNRGAVVGGLDHGVEGAALIESSQLPEPEVDHRDHPDHHEQMEGDPSWGDEESRHTEKVPAAQESASGGAPARMVT